MEQIHQKNLNIDLIRLEIDRCSFTPRILDEILDRSILDLVVTYCELHIQDKFYFQNYIYLYIIFKVHFL